MHTIEKIKSKVERLHPRDLASFRALFAASDAQNWDEQFERDVAASPALFLAGKNSIFLDVVLQQLSQQGCGQ